MSAPALSADLSAEVDYRIELMEESAAEEGETFTRNDAAVYQALLDVEASMPTKSRTAQDRRWLAEIRDWQIAMGVYSPMSDAEVASTVVSRGTVWDFKLRGVPYAFRAHVAGYR